MKRIIVIFAFLSLRITANAQKGSWYLGGNFGIAKNDYKEETNGFITQKRSITNWNASPEFETFLRDNLQLGFALNFQSLNLKTNELNPVKEKYDIFNYGVTVYSRYFFGSSSFKPFVGLNLSALYGYEVDTKGTFSITDKETLTSGASLNGGFSYDISKRISVLGSIAAFGFKHTAFESGSGRATNEFSLKVNTLNSPINLGFFYSFK